MYIVKARSAAVRSFVTVLERGKEALSYSIMAEIPERRRAFVKAILELLEQYGLSGVEIAWEWPGTMVKFGGISSDRESLISLLTDVDGVETWIDFGCPPKKLILGIGPFGLAYTLANPASYNVGAPIVGPGAEGQYYYEGYYPYYEWMSYEDTTSIGVKMNFVQEKRLGGVILQYVDYDDFWGFCGTRNPLTTFIYQRLQQIPSDIGFAIEWNKK
uniref:GH18 domain-containing protein n=1 Tax=Anopheles melas TaxID=34690 RepID=A0A182TN21_9DIPT